MGFGFGVLFIFSIWCKGVLGIFYYIHILLTTPPLLNIYILGINILSLYHIDPLPHLLMLIPMPAAPCIYSFPPILSRTPLYITLLVMGFLTCTLLIFFGGLLFSLWGLGLIYLCLEGSSFLLTLLALSLNFWGYWRYLFAFILHGPLPRVVGAGEDVGRCGGLSLLR